MVLLESGLSSEHVSLIQPTYIGKLHFGTETSLNSEGGPNFELSFKIVGLDCI